MYQHTDINGLPIALPSGKAVCVGRNYLEHIKELNNEVPQSPLLFIKPQSALTDFDRTIAIPPNKGDCHNELEIALLIGEQIDKNTPVTDIISRIWGVGLALDLTLRDVQTQLKQKGLPWEKAKAFDNSCPLSGFVPLHSLSNLNALSFQLLVNAELRQCAKASHMMLGFSELIQAIVEDFTLFAGDLVLTGTPKGVGKLTQGDELEATLSHEGETVLRSKAEVIHA